MNSEHTMKKIYLCEDTVDGIFTAIYHAWEEGTSHTDVRVSNNQSMSLFEEYVSVTTDSALAVKVADAIHRKLSSEVYDYTYQAALSDDECKASVIYHFLQKAFRTGRDIICHLQDEDVMRIFELSRRTGREAHLYLGFVRFEEHFSDRLHNENWIILDTVRNFAAVHSANKGYFLTTDITEKSLNEFSSISEKELEFHTLWQNFFHSIAITERNNPALQRNLMPLRYRKYMGM
jgi:hypothetical protein